MKMLWGEHPIVAAPKKSNGLRMKIMIEDLESLKFFAGDGLWSKNAADAKCYAATGHAFKAAKQEPVGNFNIVGYIVATKQFINLDCGRGKGVAAVDQSSVVHLKHF